MARVRYVHVQALRAALASRYRPATVNRVLCAVRGVLQEAWRLGLVPEAEYRRAIGVQGVRYEQPPTGWAVESSGP